MKFTEVPQLTAVGSYQVNMPLRYLKERIEEWIAEDGLELNPDFQRGHVWTEEQQVKYIEFLLRGGKSSRVIYFNNPYWMSMAPKDGYREFVCVDGLQRLTACFRFLNNEIPAFGLLYNLFEDKIPFDIDLLVNVNNLKTRKEVLQWYLEMNSGGTVHSDEEIAKVRKMLEEGSK